LGIEVEKYYHPKFYLLVFLTSFSLCTSPWGFKSHAEENKEWEYIIYISSSMDEFDSLLKNYIFIIGIILLLSLPLSASISFALQSFISKPILLLAKRPKKSRYTPIIRYA